MIVNGIGCAKIGHVYSLGENSDFVWPGRVVGPACLQSAGRGLGGVIPDVESWQAGGAVGVAQPRRELLTMTRRGSGLLSSVGRRWVNPYSTTGQQPFGCPQIRIGEALRFIAKRFWLQNPTLQPSSNLSRSLPTPIFRIALFEGWQQPAADGRSSASNSDR